MYGDWNWLDPWAADSLQTQPWSHIRFTLSRVMYSHYFYRGIPAMQPSYMGNDAGGGPNWGEYWRVHFIRPDRAVFPGEPIFKTQKHLEGRAVVTDAWGRSNWHEGGTGSFVFPNESYPHMEAGEGFYAHKDGYNVLYGDGHASWWGDPQQRLAWYMVKGAAGGTMTADYYNNTHSNQLSDVTAADSTYSWAGHIANDRSCCKEGTVLVWHGFDTAAGIDVGVDDNVRDW